MRKSLTTIMLAALALTVTAVARADDLFSNVAIGAPFGSEEAQLAKPSAAAPQRLAGPASLTEMLRKAGLDPREIDARVVSVKVQGGSSALPVLITFTSDNDRMRMVMILGTLKEGQEMPSDKLVGLMDANRENTEAFFAYSKRQRRTELHRLVENRSMTADRLKAELAGMARIAEQSNELWTIDAQAPATSPTAKPQAIADTPQSAPTAATPTQPNVADGSTNTALVGRWAASRSKTEAFALQINANGTFALVTVVSGKTSQSTGNFTLDGSKLTLKDTKGTQIAGTVTIQSSTQFNFLPSGATSPLTFKKPS